MNKTEQMDAPITKERQAVAMAAAILIADHAMSYAQARKKAAIQCFGTRVPRDANPSNDEIDEALLEHLNLFDFEPHQVRVIEMRHACASLMQRLAQFNPYVTGAAWKGIVSEHAHAHLQLFFDDSKEVSIALINLGIEWDATEVSHFAGLGTIEALSLDWQGHPFQISLYTEADFRGALKTDHNGRADRGNHVQLLALINADAQGHDDL